MFGYSNGGNTRDSSLRLHYGKSDDGFKEKVCGNKRAEASGRSRRDLGIIVEEA